MAFVDQVALYPALKEMYSGQVVENLVYADRPLLLMLQKKANAFMGDRGKYYPMPIVYQNPGGYSSNFSVAQNGQSGGGISEFLVVRKRGYAIGTIEQEAWLAADGDVGSFIEAHKYVFDGLWTGAANRAANHLYRSGNGVVSSLGLITGTTQTGIVLSTGQVALQNIDDVVMFEVSYAYQLNPTGTNTLRAGLGYVIAVDRDNGIVTFSSSMGGPPVAVGTIWTSAAVTDNLVQNGDFNSTMQGLQSWLPGIANVSAGDNFNGVNRSVDTRLCGLLYNGQAYDPVEALINATARVAREGGNPRHFFCNYTTYASIERELGNKCVYDPMKVGNIGFDSLMVTGHKGKIRVIPDMWCPSATGFLLQMDSWKLLSLMEIPHLMRYADGLEGLRSSTADASEFRVGYYGNLGCNAPGWNVQVEMPE